MKQLILITLMMITMGFSNKLVTLSDASLRDSSDYKTSSIVTNIVSNSTRSFTDVYGDWAKVQIVSGSEHIGKSGFMWVGRIDFTNNLTTVQGVCLRAQPNTQAEITAKVKAGATIKKLSIVPTWYLIQPENLWIYVGLVKVF